MTGEAAWLTPALLLVGVLFVAGLVAVAKAMKGFRRVLRTVECPTLAKQASLVVLQNEATGRHTDVLTCSALRGPVTCAHGCLEQLEEKRSA